MRTIDLFINHVPNVDAPHPWAVESTRTFSCSCGHKWTIPEDAIAYVGHRDEEESSFTFKGEHFNGLCPARKKANYELMSFCERYHLAPTPIQRKKIREKKQDQSLLNLMR